MRWDVAGSHGNRMHVGDFHSRGGVRRQPAAARRPKSTPTMPEAFILAVAAEQRK